MRLCQDKQDDDDDGDEPIDRSGQFCTRLAGAHPALSRLHVGRLGQHVGGWLASQPANRLAGSLAAKLGRRDITRN